MPPHDNLSAEEAIALLEKYPDRYTTRESLQDLARGVSVDTPGDVTVLYSGMVNPGVSANDLCIALSNQDQGVRLINNTETAMFLDSDEFIVAVAKVCGTTPEKVRDDRADPGNKFLFNGQDGLWAQTSERFVSNTPGNVITVTPFADGTRVFAQVELLAALNNDSIHLINDVPKEVFQHIHNTTGSLEEVNKAVAASSFDRMQGMQATLVNKSITALDSATFLDRPTATPGVVPPTSSGAGMAPVIVPGQEAAFDEGRRLLEQARLAIKPDQPDKIAVLLVDDTSTAAFHDLGQRGEIAQVLLGAADNLRAGEPPPFPLHDTNGNEVGSFSIANTALTAEQTADQQNQGHVVLQMDLSKLPSQDDWRGQVAGALEQVAQQVDSAPAGDCSVAATVQGKEIGNIVIPAAPAPVAAPEPEDLSYH